MNKKRYLIVSALLLVSFCIIAIIPSVEAEAKWTTPDLNYLVGFNNLSDTDIQKIKADRIVIKHQYNHINAIAIEANQAQIAKLLRNPNVLTVEIDGEIHILDEYDLSWGVTQIGSKVVHEQGIKGQNVKVAVIDTGVDYTHSELCDIYCGGYDFVNNDADPMDDHYHGTHCAGILAAALDGVGVVGVAPEVELYALKVLDSAGSGEWSDIIAAVEWCIDNNIQITSNSYGGSSYSSIVEDVFETAYEAGILSIASAGNSGGSETTDTTLYPAQLNSIVAVAATDNTNSRASFSSTGPGIELSAPGVDIPSLVPGGYATKSGTSMSCPHVAGLAALIEAAHPDWTNEMVRGQLCASATDLGAAGLDWLYGFGLVNAVLACGDLIPDPPTLPPVTYPITLTTYQPSEIGSDYAMFEGELNSMGEATTLEVNFFYGKHTPPVTYLKPTLYKTMTSPGRYSYIVTRLLPNTEYVCVACAFYNNWLYRGNKVFFRTEQAKPPPPPPPPTSIYVNEINFRSAGPNVKVKVVLSEAVSDARVSLLFEYGTKSESAVSYTSNGVASFQFRKIPNGLCEATVTDIANHEWDKDKGILSDTYTHHKKGK